MSSRIEYVFDDPVGYKDLKLYPVTMKDYVLFHSLAACLLIDKNSIPDIDVISMTYFEFMIKKSTKETPYLAMFDAILKIVLGIDGGVEYGYGKDGKPVFRIGESIYTGEDFEEIKKIICEQNLLDIPDETIQKEIRDRIKEAEELRRKMSGHKMANLEEQVVCVLISTNLTLEQIKLLSIRKFVKILQRADHKLHYEIYLSASMSGLVEFKDKSVIKHWMADLENSNRLKDNTMDVENLRDKIALGDKKQAIRDASKAKGSSSARAFKKPIPRKNNRR